MGKSDWFASDHRFQFRGDAHESASDDHTLGGRWVVVAPHAAQAQANAGTYIADPIGTPRGTGQVQIQITVVVNGKNATKMVTIPKVAIAAAPVLTRMPNETITAFNIRKLNSDAAASLAKTQVIAQAINDAFKNEFQQLGIMAGAVIRRKAALWRRGKRPRPILALTIPNVLLQRGTRGVNWTQNGVLGEGGDTSRIAPNQASPGTRTTMAPPTPASRRWQWA